MGRELDETSYALYRATLLLASLWPAWSLHAAEALASELREMAILDGTEARDCFGWELDTGDFNGDGYADLAVSAPRMFNYAHPDQKVLLYLGDARFDDVPDLTFTPEGLETNQFGSDIGLCDLNGDAYDDLLVSSEVVTDPGVFTWGGVSLYLGGSEPDTDSDMLFIDSVPYSFNFGSDVACGDVDGDGYEDLVVGALEYDAILYEGTSTIVTSTSLTDASASWTPGQFEGARIIPNIDVPFEVIGDYAYAYCTITANDEHTVHVAEGMYALTYVAEAGDTYSIRRYKTGRLYIYLGGPDLDDEADFVLDGLYEGRGYGLHVASGGDLNGDGTHEVAVGEHCWSRGSMVYVYFGGDGVGPGPDHVIDARCADVCWDCIGQHLDLRGDVSGDGLADLVMTGMDDADLLQVALGNEASIIDPAVVLSAPSPSGSEGLYTGGDVNGDGFNDIVMGMTHLLPVEMVWVYNGNEALGGLPDHVYMADPSFPLSFGPAVAAGDLNGDGRDEIAAAYHDYRIGHDIPPFPGRVIVLGLVDETADEALEEIEEPVPETTDALEEAVDDPGSDLSVDAQAEEARDYPRGSGCTCSAVAS